MQEVVQSNQAQTNFFASNSVNLADRRKFERITSDKTFRIYTNVVNVKYTVKISDISNGGAFIKTPFIPNVNDTISYVVLDRYGMERMFGSARVAWVKEEGSEDEIGFGIETEIPLLDRMNSELS